MKPAGKFISFFLQSHLIVATGALLLACQSLLAAGVYSFQNPVLLLIFSGAFIIYNHSTFIIHFPFMRKIDFGNQKKNCLRILLLALTIVFISILAMVQKNEMLVILLLFGVSLTYVMPVKVFEKRLKGLRNIPILKNVILALVWTLATAILPLVDEINNLTPGDLIFITAKRFFFIFSLTIAFDIRDLIKDRKNNLLTIPNLIGIKNSKTLAVFSLLIFLVIVLVHRKYMTLLHSSLPDFSFPLILSCILTIFLILLINSKRKESFYTSWMDGAIIFQFLLVYLFIFIR
ncbi:MAG: UbiA family prenyltransferase [Bacteroidia bacterium]